MKTNHDKIALLIRQAIAACREDSVFESIKLTLIKALHQTEAIGSKRNRRESQTKAFAEEAKRKNDEWMRMLRDGLKLNIPGDNYDQGQDDRPTEQ